MYFNLNMTKEAIEHNTNIKCYVGECYLDFGAGLKHTTIISVEPKDYQVLCPRDAELAGKGKLSYEAVCDIINEINMRGW